METTSAPADPRKHHTNDVKYGRPGGRGGHDGRPGHGFPGRPGHGFPRRPGWGYRYPRWGYGRRYRPRWPYYWRPRRRWYGGKWWFWYYNRWMPYWPFPYAYPAYGFY